MRSGEPDDGVCQGGTTPTPEPALRGMSSQPVSTLYTYSSSYSPELLQMWALVQVDPAVRRSLSL
ncbi:hypothetical protein NQZ68_010596 [Dissostichus eleginoides]|nr:hypothetical protein NQZ68_010596 [Dissostichus eleginoides]